MRKKRILLIILLIIAFSPSVITIARYVAKVAYNFIMEANNFYFSSDKLTIDNRTYEVNNWSGVDTFIIQFELNNKKNNLVYSSSDIAYEINLTCSDDAICEINQNSGTIEVGENTENFYVSVTPTRNFLEGESISISLSATATSPYHKTLGATFSIIVGKSGLSYQIDDEAHQPYLSMIITNARTVYRVLEAFSEYQVGDEITTGAYLALSESDKSKCASATITLTFSPNDVLIDTTTNIINQSTLGYTAIDGTNYISSLTFKVDASSCTELRFYKRNVSQNYTYPYDNATPIITFNAT